MFPRLLLAVIAAAALTIVPALIEGHYINRWGTPPDLETAADRVENFPRQFGPWTVAENGEPLDPEVCRALHVAGYTSRAYTNRETGATVKVLLMVGQAGPLIQHPPYICYARMANEQIGDMTKFHVAATSPSSEFNLLEYKRASSVTNDRFLVAYAMASDSTWKVPAMPRMEFGAAPMLYKVQLLTAIEPSQSRDAGAGVLQKFADDFCATFDKFRRDASVPAGKSAS